MSLLQETIDLSRLYGVKPTRDRGQNFLVDEKVYDAIIAAADLKIEETVLEIGPGLGFLTLRSAQKAKRVIAVELDKKLAQALSNRLELADCRNVSIFQEDIMNFTGAWEQEVKKIPNQELVVVANLPYTITSIFLRHFVGGNRSKIAPARLILMLQKEVAERIVAPVGKMSLLALSVQLYADARIIRDVSKKAFWPSPEVDSAVISLVRTDRWLKKLSALKGDENELLRLMRIGFSARRKMLKSNLSAGYQISLDKILEYFSTAKVDPKARAQELSLEDWIRLLPLFA